MHSSLFCGCIFNERPVPVEATCTITYIFMFDQSGKRVKFILPVTISERVEPLLARNSRNPLKFRGLRDARPESESKGKEGRRPARDGLVDLWKRMRKV